MPHHAPAENNAATTTRASTTLNPGRELPGAEKRVFTREKNGNGND